MTTETIWACKRSLALIGIVLLLSACGSDGGGDSDPQDGNEIPPGGELEASTFVIAITGEANGSEFTQLLGSAFAIENRLLASNAHVAEGVLSAARQLASFGLRTVRVSAFQSGTGAEFALIEAGIHPAYNGLTRSPDIGLFVTREDLPAVLPLASAEEASELLRGDTVQVNGFPGDVSRQLFQNNFEPGISVPLASLFTGTIQAIRNFDERVVLGNPPTLETTDMFEYSMDTSPGTSGSALLSDGRVVGVHNSGVIDVVLRPTPGGEVVPDREILATASFGVHVKHLLNLIDFFNAGVLSAERRFRLPPSAELIGAGGGQAVDPVATETYRGTVSNPENSNVEHQLELMFDDTLQITGTSQWPAAPSRDLPERQFTLSGSIDGNGELEFRDDTPEQIPGFRRGVYTGFLNPASGEMIGQYFEIDEATNELFYFGDWTASLQ